MNSFIYFYSKFTEEFLLLGAAGIFTLLSAYCYHWVIKRRRLGAARSQVPSGVVKAYLSQLINEAQFVRTQLFGLMGGEGDPSKFQSMFLKTNLETAGPAGEHAAVFSGAPVEPFNPSQFSGSVPSDLLERLKALESQLAQKESLVVNINVEKTKLLEEMENLKQNQKALQNSSAMSAGQDELLKKIKNLEERLEEYALFEDDLANLKRLQQENHSLKKRLEDGGTPANTVISASPAEPVVETIIAASPISPMESKEPSTEPTSKKATLDQNTIDSLLDGVSPIAVPTAESKAEPAIEAAAPAKKDDFEKLVDSVETSLNKSSVPGPTLSAVPSPAPETPAAAATAAPAATPAPAATAAPAAAAKAAAPAPAAAKAAAPVNTTTAKADAAPAPAAAAPVSEKSDEELLKEFENLLNS